MSELKVNTISNASGTNSISIGSDGSISYPNFGRKNLIINGAMQVAQRGTSATNVGGNVYSTVDRWVSEHGGVTLDQEQSTDVPSGSGFSYSRKATCQTTASLAAGDYIIPFEQRFEGYNLQQLAYGTSSAKTMTLSFWIKSSKTGTGTVEFRNNSGSRMNVTQFTISAADTWEHKTIVISGDTNNGFPSDNTAAMTAFFWLAAGSNYNTGSGTSGWVGATSTGRAAGATSSVSSGDYWQITGVQLEVGSVATPFEHRSYGEELALCQRYYWGWNAAGHSAANCSAYARWLTVATTTSRARWFPSHPVEMRAAPTLVGSTSAANFQITDYADNGSATFSGLSIQEGSNFHSQVSFDMTAADLNQGATVAIRWANNPIAYIGFDSEL